MSKSSAQRQREYRQRHLKSLTDDDTEMLERLNTLVHFSAKTQLKRLASCYGVTQRAMLEHLITEATQTLLQRLDGQQQEDFYDLKLSLRSNSEEPGSPSLTSRQQVPSDTKESKP